MTRVLFDVNVILDVLLDRSPHVRASAAAFGAVESGMAKGFLAAHAVTTIHFLINRAITRGKAEAAISQILSVFRIAAVNEEVIREALRSAAPDFEDAVTAAAARLAGCEYIVTRDPKGFRKSPVHSLTPEALLPLLQGNDSR